MMRVPGLIACLVLAGCAQQLPDAATPSSTPTVATAAATASPSAVVTDSEPEPSPATPSAATAEARACTSAAAAMSLDAQLGQLIMVGVSGGLDAAERKAITEHQLGSVLLLGKHDQGVAGVAELTAAITALNPAASIVVAADQEGGTVQRLSGPGFRTIPSAAKQAKLPVDSLQARARNWGRELAEAGVGLNLAPVADVVPADKAKTNAPIAKLNRGFGSDPELVSDKVRAVINGFAAAGVGTTAKHFPGLGAVTGNTDVAASVVDTTTTSTSTELMPFTAAIEAGVNAVMVSSARYTQIDAKNPAVFSATVIGLLRTSGFDGVVISDDLGAAAAVQSVKAGDRSLRFVQAGGDLVITASPRLVAPMLASLRKRATTDPAFATQVTQSVARVLQLKQAVGLLACG